MGLLDRLETRASKGGQWFLSNPDAFALQLFGGTGTSASGLVVNAESAMEWTALAAAIRVLSNTIASLPLPVYVRQERGKDKDMAHPLYAVLHDAPNDEMTAMEFRALIAVHGILWGAFYAEIVRANGQVRELWPWNPDRVRMQRTKAGGLVYILTLDDGGQKAFTPDQVLHIPGFATNGIVGRALAKDHAEAIGLGLATEMYTARFFGSGASPGGYLKHPEHLTEEAAKRLKSSWQAAHGGLEQAHRVAVLEEGMEWQQVTVDPEKADALGLKKFQLNEASRIVTGVPPHLIGDLERATFSNVEEQSRNFVQYGVQPWATRIEQRMQMSLFTEREKAAGYFVEHQMQGLLRGSVEARRSYYESMLNHGVFNINEVRNFENLNAIDEGDEHFIRMDMQTLDRAINPPDPPPMPPAFGGPPPDEEDGEEDERTVEVRAVTRPQVQRSFGALFHDAMQRLTARELNRVRSALKMLEAGDEAGFREFLRSYYFEKFPDEIKKQLRALFRAYAGAMSEAAAAEVDATPDEQRTVEFSDDYLDSFANRHSKSGRGQLEGLLAEPGDSLEMVTQRLDEWEQGAAGGSRAEKAADREIRQLGNAAARAALVGAGVTALVWRAVGDSCPICESLDGVVVGVEESFVNAGEVFKQGNMAAPIQPRSDIMHPPIHSGCDCVVSAE